MRPWPPGVEGYDSRVGSLGSAVMLAGIVAALVAFRRHDDPLRSAVLATALWQEWSSPREEWLSRDGRTTSGTGARRQRLPADVDS